jgi:signal transduction histidine kinase
MIEPFNLSELIATIYKDVSMCNENFEIICTCEPNVQINTDKAMTKQPILILLDNALKFTDSNGTIAINCISNDEKVVLEIIDSGCGMCEDELALIFDRFYTNDKARNRTSSGNGLGLSIAKEICELLSLEISVSSILNEGSKFQLIFPKF